MGVYAMLPGRPLCAGASLALQSLGPHGALDLDLYRPVQLCCV